MNRIIIFICNFQYFDILRILDFIKISLSIVLDFRILFLFALILSLIYCLKLSCLFIRAFTVSLIKLFSPCLIISIYDCNFSFNMLLLNFWRCINKTFILILRWILKSRISKWIYCFIVILVHAWVRKVLKQPILILKIVI
jgi:hypothetical protein